MKVRSTMAGVLAAATWLAGNAHADLISLDVEQTGGFYAGGATPDNSVAFQNYYVGYGTTPGHPRTPERRSFFWFDLGIVPATIVSAKLVLELPFGGLIFGKGPGTPGPGVPDDPFEEFAVSATPFAAPLVTSPGLDAGTASAIFESFAGPYLGGKTFVLGGPPPGAFIEIDLNATAIGYLNSKAGGDVVLTGWMPTWSEDFRTFPGGELFEGSELIFGFTDVHTGAVAKPKLELVTAPVPEPATLLLAALGLGAAARKRRKR